MTEGYYFITIGRYYIDEAYNLSLTLRKNNDNRPISLLINKEDEQYAKDKKIFDKLFFINQDTKLFRDCKTNFERYGVYPKITMDEYLPYDNNIYIDTDVLCIYDTQQVWDIFNSNHQCVQAIGKEHDPEWHFGRLNEVSEKYGKNVPHTHSGILYMRKNQQLLEFFKYCREAFYKHDEYGCKREFRGGIADEILIALSFSKFDYLPHDNLQVPIMTFNIPGNIHLPTKTQTVRYPAIHESEKPISFVHMFEKMNGQNYKMLLNRILN
jgi:hypothetical protein